MHASFIMRRNTIAVDFQNENNAQSQVTLSWKVCTHGNCCIAIREKNCLHQRSFNENLL